LEKELHQELLQDCADIPEIFGKLLWLILPFSALIFSLFILDTYGDAVSWEKALIPTGVMCCVPFLFILLRWIYLHSSVKPYVDEFFDWCRKHVPVAKVLLKSRPQDLGLRATTIVARSARLSAGISTRIFPAIEPASISNLSANPASHQSLTKVMPLDQLGLSSKNDEQRPAMEVSNDVSIEEL
jgi:hypothetical protein